VTIADAAYGVRLEFLGGVGIPAGTLALDGVQAWPRLTVAVVSDARGRTGASTVRHTRAEGTVTVDVAARRAELPEIVRSQPDFLVHPLLSTVAWLFANARSQVALHAGAFVGCDGAWVVLGERGAGKSTLLAILARAGVPIVSDDLVVLRDAHVCAGPRCIDLRPDAAELFEVTDPVRGGERRRMALGPCAAEYPLAGFLTLSWATRTALERTPAEARLQSLIARLPEAAPQELLELAAKPNFNLSRPRTLGRAHSAADAIATLLHPRP
jgi:hypothetical protein